MEVLKTKHIGFCFGVRRAIEIVEKEVEEAKEGLHTLGPIIHNPQMVETLQEKGIVPVDDISEVNKGTIVFRTHGVRKEEEEYCRKKGLRVIDVTCPFVKRVRERAVYLRNHGYKVVIIGDKNHPEVKSVLSYLDNDGIVLQSSTSVNAKKVGVVGQTTLDMDSFISVVSGLIEGVEELMVYNTICESTGTRQKEAVILASAVDLMLIVGGKNSSNTTKLYNVVKKVQPNTYHIETDDDLSPEWFSGVCKVGMTGGASTPDAIIHMVERRVNNF